MQNPKPGFRNTDPNRTPNVSLIKSFSNSLIRTHRSQCKPCRKAMPTKQNFVLLKKCRFSTETELIKELLIKCFSPSQNVKLRFSVGWLEFIFFVETYQKFYGIRRSLVWSSATAKMSKVKYEPFKNISFVNKIGPGNKIYCSWKVSRINIFLESALIKFP